MMINLTHFLFLTSNYSTSHNKNLEKESAVKQKQKVRTEKTQGSRELGRTLRVLLHLLRW